MTGIARSAACRAAVLLLLLLLLSPLTLRADAVQAVVGNPAGAPRSGEVLKRDSDHAASRLRCPVCQGLSVNDSPATMAVNMKREVSDLMARGYSEEQVLTFFEKSYGQFVLLDPPKRGINWLVWVLPAIALLGGLALVLRLGRNRSAHTLDAVDVDPALLPYIERVRAIAFGSQRSSS